MESVELIFGGATIGIGNFSEVGAVEELLLRLKELGIKRIDTAARYAGGLSETMLGEAGAANKHGFTIDTKIMFTPPGSGTLTEQAITKSIETSLGRLKVEKVRTEAGNYFACMPLILLKLCSRSRGLYNILSFPRPICCHGANTCLV